MITCPLETDRSIRCVADIPADYIQVTSEAERRYYFMILRGRKNGCPPCMWVCLDENGLICKLAYTAWRDGPTEGVGALLPFMSRPYFNEDGTPRSLKK
jgi:hypothetical protein